MLFHELFAFFYFLTEWKPRDRRRWGFPASSLLTSKVGKACAHFTTWRPAFFGAWLISWLDIQSIKPKSRIPIGVTYLQKSLLFDAIISTNILLGFVSFSWDDIVLGLRFLSLLCYVAFIGAWQTGSNFSTVKISGVRLFNILIWLFLLFMKISSNFYQIK